MKFELKNLEKKMDERGWFAEILKSDDLSGAEMKNFGQIGITTAKQGIIKGNHYHKRKVEWYCVLKGKALVVLQDNLTDERKEIIMSEKELSLLKIYPNVSHAVKNIGKGMMYLLVYTSEPFNPEDPDTFRRDVL